MNRFLLMVLRYAVREKFRAIATAEFALGCVSSNSYPSFVFLKFPRVSSR